MVKRIHINLHTVVGIMYIIGIYFVPIAVPKWIRILTLYLYLSIVLSLNNLTSSYLHIHEIQNVRIWNIQNTVIIPCFYSILCNFFKNLSLLVFCVFTIPVDIFTHLIFLQINIYPSNGIILYSSGKGKGIGSTQEVTQRSFIDCRL